MNRTGPGSGMGEQRRELLQMVVANLPNVAVALLDVDGIVLTWNAGGRAIFGYDSQEVVGRHVSRLYASREVATAPPAALQAALDAARAGGDGVETRLARKDGTMLDGPSTLIALVDPRHKLMGFGLVTVAAGAAAAATTPGKAALAAAAGASRPGGTKSPGSGAPSILVVDDDPEGCRSASDRLTRLGYRVLTAPGGEEALEALSRHPDVDLLFTDVVMPGGLSGRELAARARRAHPGLKVLFASGYFEGALVEEGRLDAREHLVVKPYRQHDLVQKLAEVLARPPRPTLRSIPGPS